MDNWSCAVCCVQMLTFANRDEILKSLNRINRKYYRIGIYDREIIPILHKYGMTNGTHPMLADGAMEDDTTHIEMKIPIRQAPAILTVRSKRYKDTMHSVLWDGLQVRDPSPDEGEINKLSDYCISEWDPILFYSQLDRYKFLQFYTGYCGTIIN